MVPSSQQKGKKPRVFSADKRAYKWQKKAHRWGGMSTSQKQQAYCDRNIAVTAREQTQAAKEQQLAADTEQLNGQREQLMQTSRNKFREADAAKLQAQRTTVWANSLVHSELNDGKLSRALSLEARLVDTGFVNLQAARRAVAAKDAQDATSDKSRLSVLPKGTSVWHFDREGRPRAATISHVHFNANPPYYAITFDDTTGEAPRETVHERLFPM